MVPRHPPAMIARRAVGRDHMLANRKGKEGARMAGAERSEAPATPPRTVTRTTARFEPRSRRVSPRGVAVARSPPRRRRFQRRPCLTCEVGAVKLRTDEGLPFLPLSLKGGHAHDSR